MKTDEELWAEANENPSTYVFLKWRQGDLSWWSPFVYRAKVLGPRGSSPPAWANVIYPSGGVSTPALT